MLYMNLFQGRLQRLDMTEAVLAFPASRPGARQDAESQRDTIRTLLAGIVGRRVEPRFVAVQDGAAGPKTPSGGAATATTAASADSELNKWSGKLGGQMVSG